MENIVNQLKEWNEAYRKGKPLVPDSVYDAMLERLPLDHPYRNTVEPEEVLYKGRIKHKKPMLSMQKAKKDVEMEQWAVKVKNAVLECNIPISEVRVRCSAKLDGIAGKLEGASLVTRGDGQYGNDVSSAFSKGLLIDSSEDFNSTELGEFVVKKSYFKKHLSEEFSHPRNFVSGAIMSDTLTNLTEKAFNNEAIIFQAYRRLPSATCFLFELLESFRDFEKDISESVDYQIDGVIFEVIGNKLREYMGETEHHPNWAIALKPKDKAYESTIIGMEWNTGRSGKVTPVVLIEPVMIDGVEVSRASGHNAKMVLDMGLDIGKRVELIRSGSVIPYIIGVVE